LEVLRAGAHSYYTVLFILLYFTFAVGQTGTPSTYSFTISASQTWIDTGVDIAAEDDLAIAAESKPESDKTCDPQGTASNAATKDKRPLDSAPAGALMAKLADSAEPVLVGSSHELHSQSPGHLFLGVNGGADSKCVFVVKVEISHSNAALSNAPAASVKEKLSSAAQVWLQGQFGTSSSGKTQSSSAVGENAVRVSSARAGGLALPGLILDSDLRQHIDTLPRRVHDHAGNLGDMVNFVVIGDEDAVKAVFEAAEWHIADVDSKEAGVKAIFETYQKKDYLEMPMSHLYLFDRMQDYGYEQAQAYSVVASRHHFRLWKAPFTSGDQASGWERLLTALDSKKTSAPTSSRTRLIPMSMPNARTWRQAFRNQARQSI
jgi:LssY C-terminus